MTETDPARYPFEVTGSKNDSDSPTTNSAGTVDRRGFLTATAIAAGVVGTGALGAVLANRGNNVVKASGLHAPSAEVKALFGSLAPKSRVGDCTVENIYGVHLGAIPVILRDNKSGKTFQVDVLKREPGGPQGVGNTKALSLFVANTGDGKQRTDEKQGLSAMALASNLAKRDRSADKISSLLTLTERHNQHPNGAYTVL